MEIAWQDLPDGGGRWLFPETDAGGNIVGKTARYRDGTTAVIPGGRRGLSEPLDLRWDRINQPFLLPVGITDTLALTALDLDVLGRPGDHDGLDDLADRLAGIDKNRRLILFAKGTGTPDSARSAAQKAAADLTARLGRPVRWALTPNGAHDLRAWVVKHVAPDLEYQARQDWGRRFLIRLEPFAPPAAGVLGFSAAELLKRQVPEPVWVVDGLLPQGATLLAGKPKGGKSWLALQLAVAVAAGAPALQRAVRSPGDVLYLALEDTERRLKSRLELFLQSAPAPSRLYLMTHWSPLNATGLNDLRSWIAQHPEVRLIVIDTLAMLRCQGGYQNDHQAIDSLRSLAARYRIALVIVHHLRKRPADDPFDSVSGTLGLTGAADSVWILARSRRSNEASLHIVGRDIDEQELALAFDPRTAVWSILGPAAEIRVTKERTAVLDLLAKSAPLSPAQIAPLLEKPLQTTKSLLWRMAQAGLLVADQGKYALPVSIK
jgi:hypothetical protein